MLDKNQWLAIGLLSGFAYILGKDRESFGAEIDGDGKYAESFGADSEKCPKCDAGNLGKEEMYYCYTCGNDDASEDGCSECGSDAVGEEEMDYCYNCGEHGHWFNAESFEAERGFDGKRVFVVSSVDYETDGEDVDLPQNFTFILDEHDTAFLEGSTDMQEIADLLVDNISDETGWLVQGFYFQERMPDGTLVDLDAESFGAEDKPSCGHEECEEIRGMEGWLSDREIVFKYFTQWRNNDNPSFNEAFFTDSPIQALNSLSTEDMNDIANEQREWVGCYRENWNAESFEAKTPCAVMVLKDGVLTECGWWNENNEPCVYHPDGKEIKAESFSAENYYGRNYRGFEINKEGDERQAFYYLTQGDNRIEIEFTKSVEGRRKRGDNYNYASYFYGNYPHTAEKMFETFDEALNWFDEQIDNGRMFKDFKAESFGAESQQKKSRYKITMDSWPMRIHVDGCPIAKNIPKEYHWEETFTPQEVAQAAYDTLFFNESLPQFEGNTFGELRKTYAKDLIIPCNCTIHEMKSIKELDPATFTRQPNETQEHWDAESFKAKEEIYVFRDNLNTGYVGKPSQFKTKYGSSDVKELKQIIKQKDDLERVPSLIKFELKPKTIKRVISRKTPMPVDFNWTHQWNAESFEALDDSSLCVICKENEATEGRYETIVCEDCAYGTASNPGWSNWRRTNHEDSCPSCNNEEELWVGDWMRCSKCNDSFCENCETDGQTLCEQCFENKDAESFEAENLYNSQKENMILVALGRAHQEILNGGERATMEIWFEGRPVMFAIDNAAGYFAINPRVLQSRYDSHNFVEPEWRDEYHQALSALKEAFPTWSMFSPKLEKSFDL